MSARWEGPPVTVGEAEIPTWTDEKGGWHATVEGAEISSPSYAGLAAQAGKATRRARARIRVEFMATGHRGEPRERVFWVSAVTGRHPSSGRLQIANDDGLGHRGSEGYMGYRLPPLSEADTAEWGRLLDAVAAAEEALRQFEKPRRFDVMTAVNKALAEQ